MYTGGSPSGLCSLCFFLFRWEDTNSVASCPLETVCHPDFLSSYFGICRLQSSTGSRSLAEEPRKCARSDGTRRSERAWNQLEISSASGEPRLDATPSGPRRRRRSRGVSSARCVASTWNQLDICSGSGDQQKQLLHGFASSVPKKVSEANSTRCVESAWNQLSPLSGSGDPPCSHNMRLTRKGLNLILGSNVFFSPGLKPLF